MFMSSPNIGAKQFGISDLPSEILQKIFKYLSVEERKAVKSVCKSWLKWCNIRSLLDDDVLVCWGFYQLLDTYKLLDKSEREFLNLKFENVTFDHGSSFWKHNGPRIRSIDFVDCQFPDGILEDIIVSCANLFHLSFIYTDEFKSTIIDEGDEADEAREGLRLPIKDLEKISRKGIVRKDLQSLKIDIIRSKWFDLSDYFLYQLLMIFPRIKILKISCDLGFDLPAIDINLSEATNKNRITMSPVLNYLISSSEQIEKVKLHFCRATFSPSGLRCILETVSSLKRLTELSIKTGETTNIAPVLKSIDTSFCSKQLKSLKFCMNLSSDDLMLFLSKFLLPNSSLQYLTIDLEPFSDAFILTKSLYEKLILSGLKSFVVIASKFSMQDYNSFSSCSSAQNRTSVLPSLSAIISKGTRTTAEMLWLLQYYQTLHHLSVDYTDANKLQILLKYQKNLRSLTMHGLFRSEVIIHPEHLGFNELTDIEWLDLGCPPVSFFFLRTLAPKPILSKLKYLFIKSQAAEKMLFPSDLLRAADVMPFLERLCVYDTHETMSLDNIVKLCTKLSRLRHLYYDGNWLVNDGALTDEHYHKVFSICSSLRVLVHWCDFKPSADESRFGGRKVYVLDTLNKKVLKNPMHNEFFIRTRPRISGFRVPRLMFW